MKKFLKMVGIIFAVLILLIILLPIVFKGKIQGAVEEQIANNVNAEVTFGDFGLSVFSDFPNLTVELSNLKVVGKERFEKDTLLKIETFALSIDFVSAMSGELNVESILLKSPKINVIVTADSLANYDIAKSSEAPVDEKKTETTAKEEGSSGDFSVELKSFKITDADLTYRDSTSNLFAYIHGFNYTLSGNFSEKSTTLSNDALIERLTVLMGGVKYLNKAKLTANADIEADLENQKFTFKDNVFGLNKIKLEFEGVVSMPDTVNIDMDLKFGAKELNFKELLSMVPAIYTKDFDQLTAKGELGLTGAAKGRFGPASYPASSVHLWVKNGMFKYADLPKSVDNIQVDLKVDTKAGKDIDAEVNLSKGHIELAKNPVDVKFFVHYYPTDMDLDAALKGRIDLESIADAIPMDDIKLKGLIAADATMKGKYSDVEKENYEEFKTGGSVELKAFQFKNEMLPQGMDIGEAKLEVSSKTLALNTFKAKTGKTDFSLTGNVSNYIQYVFKNQTINGQLNVNSNLIDANELMANMPESADTTQAQAQAQSQPEEAEIEAAEGSGIVEVPDKINFRMNTNIKKLKYDSLTISSIKGLVEVKNKKMSLTNLSMLMLDGKLIATGAYNTKNIKKPIADFNLDIQKFDIQKAVKSFSSVPKVAPIARETRGRVSAKMNLFTVLDTAMSPVLNTIDSKGTVSSKNINVQSKLLGETGKLIKKDGWDDVDLKDFNLEYTVKKGVLTVKPLVLDIKGQKLNFKGSQTLEGDLNYFVSTDVNSKDVGLPDFGLVPVDIKVTGKMNNPKYGLDTRRAQEKLKESFAKKTKDALLNKENKKKLEEEGKKLLKGLFK